MSNNRKLAEQIKAYLLYKEGLSRKGIASRLGVSRVTVGRWEKDLDWSGQINAQKLEGQTAFYREHAEEHKRLGDSKSAKAARLMKEAERHYSNYETLTKHL